MTSLEILDLSGKKQNGTLSKCKFSVHLLNLMDIIVPNVVLRKEKKKGTLSHKHIKIMQISLWKSLLFQATA